jgi:NAD(P)-dependent dehydrogenase (short-subunit alcohol dehydrogenase family)
MDIKNHVAVVTGGASGLGAACVALLRQRGARVMVWDRRVDEHDKDALVCDVRSEIAVKHALDETTRRFGVPRININCAGIAPSGRLVGKKGPLPLAAFQDVIDINLVGTFNVMRFVTDAMTKLAILPGSDERGVIINTASIAAYDGQIGQVAYSASKGAIVSMTLPVARELAQHNIRVNAVAPGLMATPLLLNMPSNVQESLAASVPFPKRFGHPEEFAALVLHVIENSMLNGEVIRLDGALRMPPR